MTVAPLHPRALMRLHTRGATRNALDLAFLAIVAVVSAAPTARQAAPTATRSTTAPSVQPHGAAVTTAVVAVAKLRICFVVLDFISVPISSLTSVKASFGVFLRVVKFISENVLVKHHHCVGYLSVI